MRTIDVHAHMMPQSMFNAFDAGREWYGMRYATEDRNSIFLRKGKVGGITSPKVRLTLEQRLKDMDEQKVDIQLVSLHTMLFGYHLEASQSLAQAREINDELAAMVRQGAGRIAGMGQPVER